METLWLLVRDDTHFPHRTVHKRELQCVTDVRPWRCREFKRLYWNVPDRHGLLGQWVWNGFPGESLGHASCKLYHPSYAESQPFETMPWAEGKWLVITGFWRVELKGPRCIKKQLNGPAVVWFLIEKLMWTCNQGGKMSCGVWKTDL